ncbi:MAG: VWA domain-containing protein, partial [Oscillospiraceae bacterium]|nr:VWA domain-containing protein [Oscillospiraceae bacterium]
MKNLKHYTNKILAVLLLIALTVACLPLSMMGQVAAAGTNPYYNRVVDANTMDLWKEYFDLEDLTTINAGGVWTDKSVFKDPTGVFPQSVTMLDSDENFLTALSVLGANKEIMGYSTIPTDTVLVLDLSNSMQNSGDHDDLVDAANDTIEALLNINRNNRVGVVLYSGNSSTGSSTYSQGVTRILPMGRYTVDTNRESEKDDYLVLSGAWVSLNEDLLDADGNEVTSSASKEFEGGTYIQAGLWEAMKMFEEQDTVIEDDNWQGGKDRMPIMVLMTDGGPSTATTYYDNVENSEYSYTTQSGGRPGRPRTTTTVTEKGSNVGTGNTGSITTGSVFLTQLTASYTMARIQNHYGTDVDGLFYTLGFNVGNDATATSVLDPTRSTLTDSLWNTYMQLSDQATMGFSVRNWQGNSTTVSISRNPYVAGEDYVDRYFSAESGGLSDVFEDLVEEIILQSKYYPTHLQGGSADFSGYVTFEDVIGSFMEVKDIKGILLGDHLYSGQMMAALLDDPDGFGTGTNPTEYGNEFVRSVKTRLNIETADAQNLIRNAYEEGQLSYVTDSRGNMLSYSNYVGWYAKADMTYISPWDDKTTAPSDAVYQVKSYVYLGEETGNQKDSDMMYMTVQLRTRIDTGEQSIVWKVPASLVPMVTYLVSLEGDNIDEAENVSVTIEDAENISPIRLLFESGLKSNWNELNVHTITDSRNVADDGVSRRFWTNYFDISGTQHELHKTATAQFMPSEENERFYYTSDSVIYKKTLTGYTKVTEEDGLALGGEYYHRRYIFTEDSNVPIFEYEKLSVDSIEIAIENGWQADYTFADNSKGAYIVPAGTVTKELEMYSKDKKENETDSAHMIFYPYINYENGKSSVRMNLGNNGLLTVTPAQGISLTKTVDRPVVGSTGEFSFRLTAKDAEGNLLTGSYSYWITEKGVVPTEGKPATAVLSDGTFVFSLKADETIWMIGLPTDATWTIAEITPNSSYKVSSVHVDGISTGTLATGKVTAHKLADVQFVNTPLTDGNLLINKNVLDENGNDVAINSNVKYEIEVTLANNALPVAGEYTMNTSSGSEVITVGSDGKFSVNLADGETVEILDLPEKTTWTAVEKNVPVGFSFDANASTMSGSISADDTSVAYVINRYEPTSVGGDDISVLVKKTISGNRTTWMPGEAYTFVINRLNPLTRAAATEIFRATINGDTPDHSFTYSLENEEFTAPDTYYYQIMELEGPSGNGVTYDTVVREFSVVVADSDMDGDLEIVSVNNVVLTTVEDNVVSADFENVYQ